MLPAMPNIHLPDLPSAGGIDATDVVETRLWTEEHNWLYALLRSGDLKISQKMRLEADTPLYAEIHDTWSRKLEAAVHSLPRFPWEPPQEREDVPGPLPAMPPRRIPSRQDPGDAQGQQQ